jgi:hypothetical protein
VQCRQNSFTITNGRSVSLERLEENSGVWGGAGGGNGRGARSFEIVGENRFVVGLNEGRTEWPPEGAVRLSRCFQRQAVGGKAGRSAGGRQRSAAGVGGRVGAQHTVDSLEQRVVLTTTSGTWKACIDKSF